MTGSSETKSLYFVANDPADSAASRLEPSSNDVTAGVLKRVTGNAASKGVGVKRQLTYEGSYCDNLNLVVSAELWDSSRSVSNRFCGLPEWESVGWNLSGIGEGKDGGKRKLELKLRHVGIYVHWTVTLSEIQLVNTIRKSGRL